MKKLAIFMVAILGIAVVALTIINAQVQQEVKSTSKDVTPLPASLDNFFPPRAEQPIFLFRMLGMAKPLSGIMADLSENDFPNVIANFEQFKVQYVEVSKLVPEWEKNFPLAPVNELGVALKSGDQGKVMAAFESVGKVCSDCHLANQSKAYFKYHWGDFHGIKIKDPLSQQEVAFQQFMLFLDGSFTGIEIDVEQGQIDNARRQL